MLPRRPSSFLAGMLACCIVAEAAAPAWANIARVSLSVKPSGGVPVSGLSINRGLGLRPSLLNGMGAEVLRLKPTLIGVHSPHLSPHVSASRAAIQVQQPSARQRQHPPTTRQGRQSVGKRITGLFQAAQTDQKKIKKGSGSGIYKTARTGFARLLGIGLTPSRKSAAPVKPHAGRIGAFKRTGLRHSDTTDAPSDFEPPAPSANKRTVRTYLLGTGIFKIGMEALSLSAPLLALTIFGEVKYAAILVVGWGLSQIVFGSLSGGLLDRRSPSKILGWSMILQAVAVTGLIGLFAADHFLPGLFGFPMVNPYSLLTLYSLAGGFMGVADTARQVIPPEIVPGKERALKIFNAKTHIAYEIAGVTGAILTGIIIANFGIVPALLLHPPAYLLAAFVFWRLKLKPRRLTSPQLTEPTPDDARNPNFAGSKGRGNPFMRAIRDIVTGAKTVFSKPIFRWSSLALIIPLVTHRLLEGLLIPVTAKTLLGDPSAAAWIIGASNFGELLGAVLLMRAILSTKGETKRFRSSFWVRLMTIGSLGILALTFSQSLYIILPLIAFRSMTWAASELSLRSKLQKSIPNHLRGRTFAFIGAVAFALIMAASLGVGFLMDILPRLTVFYGVDIAIILAAVFVFFTASKLNGKKTKKSK